MNDAEFDDWLLADGLRRGRENALLLAEYICAFFGIDAHVIKENP